jgi:hypothetical protein
VALPMCQMLFALDLWREADLIKHGGQILLRYVPARCDAMAHGQRSRLRRLSVERSNGRHPVLRLTMAHFLECPLRANDANDPFANNRGE